MVESDARFAESGYANPGVLVSTEWVAEHLSDPQVRIVESDEDVLLYDLGHIPGAVNIDWHVDLQNPVERDFLDKAGFEALLSKHGIGNDTTVVFYGDRNNWYATYAYWLFRYFGHADARVMNGGRAKWEAEGRPGLQQEEEQPAPVSMKHSSPSQIEAGTQIDLTAKLEASKALAYKAAEAYNDDKFVKKGPVSMDTVRAISMAKIFTGEVGTEVADQCMQFHGGAGYIEEYHVARAWRDQRLFRIGGGTTETLRYYVAKLMGL